MTLIDTHCHFDWPDFDTDRSAILQSCAERGVEVIVVPAVKAEHFDRVLDLCRGSERLLPALGLHPVFLEDHQESDLDRLRALAPHCRAIGEIGLDYFVPELNTPEARARQQAFLEAQLAIAHAAGLPVLLHARRCHADLQKILKGFPGLRGVVHAFSGSLEEARGYVRLGFLLGIGGAYTYPAAQRLRKVWQALPLESIVLETDAPDMAPAMHRGDQRYVRNQPDWVADIALDLATQRGMTVEALADITTRNARSLLEMTEIAH